MTPEQIKEIAKIFCDTCETVAEKKFGRRLVYELTNEEDGEVYEVVTEFDPRNERNNKKSFEELKAGLLKIRKEWL